MVATSTTHRNSLRIAMPGVAMLLLTVAVASAAAQVGAAQTPTVGLQWRVSAAHVVFASTTGTGGPADPNGPTRVGVEWQPAKSTLGFDHGALGLQLDSGYRLSLRARGGGAALYLRGRF